MKIKNLALTDVLLYGNSFFKNTADNLRIAHLHHKANKRNVFQIDLCLFTEAKNGFGLFLFDTSVTLKNSSIDNNSKGGVFCGCPVRPDKLTKEVLWFLKKFPMSI